MTAIASSAKKNMVWHYITVGMLIVSAVLFVIAGAMYISAMIYDTVGITELMNAGYEAYPGLKTGITIVNILYGLALIYLGMERIVTFNAMRVCEGGACALLRHSYVLSMVINAAYIILSVAMLGIFCGVLLTDVFMLFYVPAGLAVLSAILFFVNGAYYEKRVQLFTNYDSGVRVKKAKKKK